MHEKQHIERALRTHAWRRTAKIILWLGVIALAGYGVYYLARGEAPAGPDLSRAVEIAGETHVAEGTVVTTYNSNPPTSGDHYATPARIGFYERELPDERIVHNLEHGDVWISYRPGIPQEAVEQLRAFTKDIKVIVTPRSKNETDIALAAWGRLDAFNLESGTVDAERIRGFILRYRNRGPEQVINSGDHLPQE